MGNGRCHAECYTADCKWDGGDCEGTGEPGSPSKCAEKCPPMLLNNHECDEECNVEACMFDGNRYTLDPSNPHHVLGDCDHGHTECYTDPSGKDYRGSINETEDGDECSVWETKSGAKYVNHTQSGLGGHNHCRNPTTAGKTYGSKPVDGDRPWCWRKRDDFDNAGENWGYCNVQSANKVCGDQSISGKIDHALSELSNEAAAAPLIAAILSIASVLLLGLLVFVYRMRKWHMQIYATLQQQLQASQELSALTSTVDDGDSGAETEPPGLTPVKSRVVLHPGRGREEKVS